MTIAVEMKWFKIMTFSKRETERYLFKENEISIEN